MEEEVKLSKDEEQAVIHRVMSRESEWDSYESENISEAIEDLEFLDNKQWNDRMITARTKERVRMTVNKLGAPVKRISNEFRQNSIGIRITPQESNDKNMARIRQGLIRNIEKLSNAKAIYSAAFDSAVSCGFGYFRVLSDYKRYDSDDQDLKIEMINNAFAVKMDFRRKWVWGHDAKWCIINDELSHDDFKWQFPKSDMAKNNLFKGNYPVGWVGSENIKVTEYFECQYKQDQVLTLKDGTYILASKFEGKKNQIKKTRDTVVPYIHWYKLTCHEVLKHTILPIKYIPVICMPGEVAWVKDKRVLRSLIRFAKDSQRSYNIHKSNAMEKNEMAPKAPFALTPKQIKGFEGMYADANVKNYPYLLFNPDPENPGAPQRMGYVNQSAGDEQLAMQDAEDIKTITGVYDPALGAQSNEVSGVAIKARSGQSQTINYNFHDNAAMAIQYEALILNDWCPHVYDGERMVRILGEGERDEIVTLNSSDPEDPLSKFSSDDELYDVNVEVGPAYQTQMQEAFEVIMQMLPNMNEPQRDATFDIAMQNLNFTGADTLQKRFNKYLQITNPKILEDEAGGNKSPDDPEVLAQELSQANQVIDQMQQAIQMSEQALNQLQGQIAQLSDEQEKQIRLEELKHKHKMEELKLTEASKMKNTEMNNNTKLEVPILNSMLQTGQAAMMAPQSQAPAYVEQELQEVYSEDNSPEMDVEMMSEQNVPAQLPGQSPEMEQMQ